MASRLIVGEKSKANIEPDTGFHDDDSINCFGPIRLIARAPVGALAISGTL